MITLKVVLITPGTGQTERLENQAAWPPLGLLYLGTVLQNAGHEVKIIDNARIQLPVEKVAARVKKEDPRIVGVSALTPTFKQGIKIVGAVKSELPDVKIAFGNYHATFTYEKLLMKYPIVDYVILGEGESTFLELVNAVEKNHKIKNINGIAFRHSDKVVTTPPMPSIENLDELPFPDRTLLEHNYYSEVVGVLGSSGKFTTMITSRGCPYACTYCACAAFSSRRVRFRFPESVVAEMEMLWSEGYEEIGFVDDNLFVNRQRVEKICDLLKEKKIKLYLWAEGRVDHAPYEMLRKFALAGCKTIYFGIESSNQKVLDYYKKNISPELSRKAVRNCKKAGIENVIGSFIVGAPFETKEDIRRTFDFALSLDGMDFPQMNVLMLSLGTDLWNMAIREGYLDKEKYWDKDVAAVNIFPSYIREDELRKMIDRFYAEFIKRSTFLVTQLLKSIKSKYRMKIFLSNMRAGTSLRAAIKQLQGG
jgi:radical SAM superfamily enzyme YgiQ (UPF0313 family)